MTSAMILAAGRGERLRPYTDTCPKPLLEIDGKPLIFYHLEALAETGIERVVINTSWLGSQIRAAVSDGQRFGLEVVYSEEPEALETAGGIVQALAELGDRFIVVNGDIFTDFRFQCLDAIASGAHLVLAPNPDFNADGDFAIKDGLLNNGPCGRHTFAGIAIYDRSFFRDLPEGRRSLAPLLRQAADRGELTGEVYRGRWVDIGTVQRWQSAKPGCSDELPGPD